MFRSINTFILLLFFGSFTIFFYIKPIDVESSLKYRDYKEIPLLSFSDFHIYDFDENRIVRTTLQGQYGEAFENSYYRIKDVELTYKSSRGFENISSNYAYYKNQEIDIIGDVTYSRDDGVKIDTDQITYDIRDDYFYIPKKFSLYQMGSQVNGRTLVIKRRDGTINAFNIEAVIKLGK
jgi:LPS export ABC transporter protein LptC